MYFETLLSKRYPSKKRAFSRKVTFEKSFCLLKNNRVVSKTKLFSVTKVSLVFFFTKEKTILDDTIATIENNSKLKISSNKTIDLRKPSKL